MNLLTPLQRRTAMPAASLFDQWMRNFFAENGREGGVADLPMVPRADVAENDAEYEVTIELPGVEPGEVEVRVVNDQLVVSGERKQKREEKDKHWVMNESIYGAFERRFDLPRDVRREGDGIVATFGKGLLDIRLPKVKTATRKIAVKPV